MNCFLQSCLILRRALGHLDCNMALERLRWTPKGPLAKHIPALLAEIFPEHQVVIQSPFRSSLYKNMADNVLYVGKSLPEELYEDAYLWMFSYSTKDSDNCHVVVGQPSIQPPGMKVQEVIGVSIAPLTMLRKSQPQTVKELLEQQAQESVLPLPEHDDAWWAVNEEYLEELQARVDAGMKFGTLYLDDLPEQKAMVVEEEEEPEEPPWWEVQPQPSRIVMKMARAPQWVDIEKRR